MCLFVHVYWYLCLHMVIGKVSLPVQFLWGPFKIMQGIAVMQSSVSVCDLIVSGPKDTKHPDKLGQHMWPSYQWRKTWTLGRQRREVTESTKERHYMKVEREKKRVRYKQQFSCNWTLLKNVRVCHFLICLCHLDFLRHCVNKMIRIGALILLT